MAPLQAIDPNVPRAEHVSATPPRLVDEDDEEEVVSSDSDSDVGAQLPGRPVARDPYSDSEGDRIIENIFAGTDVVPQLHEQQRADTFTTSGINGATWCRKLHCTQPQAFAQVQGMRTSSRRGRRSLDNTNFEPIDYWRMFITDEMLDDIVCATRVRVIQRMAHTPPDFYAARHGAAAWPSRTLRKQEHKPMTKKDLEQFIGIAYGLGVTYKRGIQDAFSDDWLIGVPWVQRVMSFGKFQRLKNSLSVDIPRERHVEHVDPISNSGVSKIGVLMEKFKKRCLNVYQPKAELSYDEQVAKTNTRFSKLQQRLRHKKYNGIQIYSLCEAGSGYLVTFVTRQPTTEFSIEGAMFSLLKDVSDKWHRVYADNLFISTKTLRWCKDNGIYLCGTARTTHGFPAAISRKFGGVLEKGESSWRMTRDGLCAIAWHDSVVTQFMSNWHNPEAVDVVRRREKGERDRSSRNAPKVAADYNKFMGGVDQLDALRGTYTCRIKAKKWYFSLLWWMLDVAMINAHHVYCVEEGKAKRKPMTRDKFIKSVVESLIAKDEDPDAAEVENDGSGRKRARNEAGTMCEKVRPCTFDRRRQCKNCYNRRGVISKQNTGCSTCEAPLCVDCISEWHERRLDEK